MSYGCAFGFAHPVLAGRPVRRVDHRGDVVEVLGHHRDVLGDLGRAGRGDTEDGRAEERLVRFQRGARLREERGDRPLRARLQPRELHRRERAVGPADVVVEDVVDAELGRGHGEVDLVAADDRVREVGEAAVGRAVVAAVRGLDHLVALPVRPCPLGVGRVVEADEAPDHAHALVVQRLDGVGEVHRHVDGADLARERHRRVPADLPAFLLQVELDRVDPALRDQVEHAVAETVVGPRVGGHVDGPDRVRREPGLDGDPDALGRGVAQRCRWRRG